MVGEMFPEMIPILLLFLKIVLSSAHDGDNAPQTQLPDDQICLFTCSEWIFKEKVQQFAPSADLLGAGYLSKHEIGFSSDDPNSQSQNDSPMQYQKVWGAVYSINKNEYDAVLKQSQTEYSVPFTSNEDVFVVKYNEMNCVVVDLGIQPGDHPPWRPVHTKIPNSIEDEAYYNRLAEIGVPQDYINGLRNASQKPQYHPIIPQDYHPKENDQQPRHTFDQLPSVQVQNQPNPRKLLPGVPNPNSQPQVVTDIPEYPHDVQVIVPKDIDSGSATTPDQAVVITPMKLPDPQDVQVIVPKDIDSGNAATPDQPAVVITPMKLPDPHDVQVIIPKDIDSGSATTPNQPVVVITPMELPDPHDVQVIVPKDIDSGSATTPDQPVVVITPMELPDPHDVQVIVPKDIDSGSVTTPDQSVVVITPMELPGSSTVKPVVAKPIDTEQKQSPAVIPVMNDNFLTKPEDVPPMLLSGPKQQTQVGPVVAQQAPKQGNLLPPDVTSSPRLPIQDPDLLINPLLQPGNETPESLPTSYDLPCDHDVPGSNSDLLTVSPTPDLTTMHPNDSPLLTLNDQSTVEPSYITHQISPNTVDIDSNPDLLLPQTAPNDVSFCPDDSHTVHSIPAMYGVSKPVPILPKKPMFEFDQSNRPSIVSDQSPVEPSYVPYQITPDTVDINNNPDILLPQTAPNNVSFYPDDSHTVHPIPAMFSVSKPVPVLPEKPMFELDQSNGPSVVSDQSPVEPSSVTYQIPPDTLDIDNNPDLLLPQTAPNNVSFYPDDSHTVHSIPTMFSVSKPVPILPEKPMFGFDQSLIPTSPSDNKQIPLTPQTTSNTIDVDHNPNLLQTNTAPNHLQTIYPIPDSYVVPKPAPVISDKPMFTIDQSNSPDEPTSTSYQINPNTLDHIDNPDLLRTSTVPNNLQLDPTGDQTVHPIPSSFGVSKPAAVVPDRPMFRFEQSNQPSSSVIPATLGISSQPPVIHDEPMFSLDSSPSLSQPEQIDDGNLKIPSTTQTPIDDVLQPHPIGINTDSQPDVVSHPVDVPLTTSTIPASTTVQKLPNYVDDSHPVQLTSEPRNAIGTTNIPESSMLQAPNSVVNNANPIILTSKPDTVSATTIPNSPIVQNQIPNQVVNNGSPSLLTSTPDKVPLTSTATPQTPKVSPQPVQQVPKPTYTPSTFMAPNYMPVSPALGYSFAYRYPQYLHNSNYQPPNCFYDHDELIPGFTFGSFIQLY